MNPLTPHDPPLTTSKLPFCLRAGASLSLKTTLFLLVLLTGAIAVGGFIFLRATHSMIHATERSHVQQTAEGLAKILSEPLSVPQDRITSQNLADLATMANLDFIALSNPDMHLYVHYQRNPTEWQLYKNHVQQAQRGLTTKVGQVQPLNQANGPGLMYVILPIWKSDPTHENLGKSTKHELLGYLHIGAPSGTMAAGTRMLETTILATCLLMALAAIPTAVLASRHITVPIHKVARAAQGLAEGRLFERVQIQRSDELGGLAKGFNMMAQRLQEQHFRLENIHVELEATVEQRTAELHRVNHRLQAEMTEKEDFLRAVSHDLNAPLRNIGGIISMLLLKHSQAFDPDIVQRLERIQTNVQVESELINELLELSRIRSRRERIESVDLHQLVQAVADQFSNDLENKGITLTIANQLPVMQCEKMRLRQVFMNLLDNAIKYMRPEAPKEITIRSTLETDDICFEIADTGLGIAPEDLSHIFHVFRRAKSAVIAQIPGKGVGLASVKAIIENYGGKMEVHSQIGQGTQFRFYLPRKHFAQPLSPEVAA